MEEDKDLYGIQWKEEVEIIEFEPLKEGSWLMYIGNNQNVKHEVL